MEGVSYLSWMAWTWQTAIFFSAIFLSIAAIGIWDYKTQNAGSHHGFLGLETTRGDRLFITLLGSAFIMLGWLGMMGVPLWGGVGLCLLWGLVIFRWG